LIAKQIVLLRRSVAYGEMHSLVVDPMYGEMHFFVVDPMYGEMHFFVVDPMYGEMHFFVAERRFDLRPAFQRRLGGRIIT